MGERINPRAGIPPESLTDPVWFNVVRVYFESVSEHYVPPQEEIEMGYYQLADQALDAFDGFRFGSRLTGHSKLKISHHRLGELSLVYFDFDPNSRPNEEASFEKSEGISVDDLITGFRTNVDEYLLSDVDGAQQFQPKY